MSDPIIILDDDVLISDGEGGRVSLKDSIISELKFTERVMCPGNAKDIYNLLIQLHLMTYDVQTWYDKWKAKGFLNEDRRN